MFFANRKRKRRNLPDSQPAIVERLEQKALLTSLHQLPIAAIDAPAVEFDNATFFVEQTPSSNTLRLKRLDNANVTTVFEFGQVNGAKVFAVGNNLVSAAFDSNALTLRSSQGVAGDAVQLGQFNGSSSQTRFAVVNDVLVFSNQSEVWRTDGTLNGTFKLADFSGQSLTVAGDTLYFVGDDGLHGSELHRTDGNTVEIVANFSTGNASSLINVIHSQDDGIFIGVGWDHSSWLVRNDGSRVRFDIGNAVHDAREYNGDIYFIYRQVGTVANFENSVPPGDVWVRRSDGTVEKIYANTFGTGGRAGAFEGEINGRLLFSQGVATNFFDDGRTGYPAGLQTLFATDGTNVEELHEFAYHNFQVSSQSSLAVPLSKANFDGELVYMGFRPNTRTAALFATNGTAAGTRLISSQVREANAFVNHDSKLWFVDQSKVLNSLDSADNIVAEHDLENSVYEMNSVGDDLVIRLIRSGDNVVLLNDDVLAAPTFITPPGDLAGPNPVIEWNSVPGADFYEFRGVGESSTQKTYRDVETFGPHTFEVRSVQGSLRSEWSSITVFSLAEPDITFPGRDGFVFESPPTIDFRNQIRGVRMRWDEIFPTTNFNDGEQVTVEFVPLNSSNPTIRRSTSENALRIVDLEEGAYRYRARAEGWGRTSEWTEFQTLHVVGDWVRLLTPFESSDVRPVFRWNRGYQSFGWGDNPSNPVEYRLQVTNVATGQALIDESGLTSLEFTPASDLPAGNYEARVATQFDGEDIFGTTIQFSVGMDITGLSPSGQTAANPAFQWDSLAADATYELWVNQIGGQRQIINETSLTLNGFQVTDSLPDGLYQYWVRGTLANGDRTQWSEPQTFTVGAPVVPEITSPGGPGTSSTPTFNWTAPPNATGWRLYIRNRDSAEVTVISEDDLATNSYTLPESLQDGRYSAWVRGYANGAIATAWSPEVRFSIGEFPTIDDPGIVTAPEYQQHTYNYLGDRPELTWTAVSDAVSYDFVLRSQQAEINVFNETGLTETSFTSPYLLPGGIYRAWVRAVRADGSVSRWSPATDLLIAHV